MVGRCGVEALGDTLHVWYGNVIFYLRLTFDIALMCVSVPLTALHSIFCACLSLHYLDLCVLAMSVTAWYWLCLPVVALLGPECACHELHCID